MAVLPPSFLSSSPAMSGTRPPLLSREKAQGGCGPQRSEDTALCALTAAADGLQSRGKGDELSKDG